MRHADQLDIEGADGAAVSERHDLERKAVEHTHLRELRLEHLGGEGGGIDGDAAKERPEIDHCAEMVLVRMGEQEAGDIVALLLEEADVGEDDVDARLLVAAEGDAHVDDQPLARPRAAVAVEVEIHADLANAAERHEDELGAFSVRFSRHVAAF